MDNADKIMSIFVILILMLIVYLVNVEALVIGNILLDPSMDWPDDTYAMTMCKILYDEPFYDCNVTWVMIFLPTTFGINQYCLLPGEERQGLSWVTIGCAVIPLDKVNGESTLFIIGSQHDKESHTGQSVLQHELKHMICKCNFHE
jgi:hypothetical protein